MSSPPDKVSLDWICEVCGASANESRNANPYRYEPHRRCSVHPFTDTLREASEKELQRGAN